MFIEVPCDHLVERLRHSSTRCSHEFGVCVGTDTGLEDASGYPVMVASDTNTGPDLTDLIVHHLLAVIVALEQTEELDHV